MMHPPFTNDTFVELSRARNAMVAFTLLRGGPAIDAYEMYTSSRRCLRDALHPLVQYDDVAFHEGNVPQDIQRSLRHQL